MLNSYFDIWDSWNRRDHRRLVVVLVNVLVNRASISVSASGRWFRQAPPGPREAILGTSGTSGAADGAVDDLRAGALHGRGGGVVLWDEGLVAWVGLAHQSHGFGWGHNALRFSWRSQHTWNKENDGLVSGLLYDAFFCVRSKVLLQTKREFSLSKWSNCQLGIVWSILPALTHTLHTQSSPLQDRQHCKKYKKAKNISPNQSINMKTNLVKNVLLVPLSDTLFISIWIIIGFFGV